MRFESAESWSDRRRSARRAVAVGVIMSFVAACGGTQSAGSSLSQVQLDAFNRTIASGSVAFELTTRWSDGARLLLVAKFSGVSTFGAEGSGEGTLQATSPLPGSGARCPGAQVAIRWIGTTFYENACGQGWTSKPMDHVDLSIGQESGVANPAALLDALKHGSVGAVDRVGSSSLQGTPTTEYRATVNFSTVAPYAGYKGPLTTLLFWIDSQGRLRQMSYNLQDIAGPQFVLNIGYILVFSNFGVDVNVRVP